MESTKAKPATKKTSPQSKNPLTKKPAVKGEKKKSTPKKSPPKTKSQSTCKFVETTQIVPVKVEAVAKKTTAKKTATKPTSRATTKTTTKTTTNKKIGYSSEEANIMDNLGLFMNDMNLTMPPLSNVSSTFIDKVTLGGSVYHFMGVVDNKKKILSSVKKL